MNVSGTGPLKLTGSADAPLQNLKLFGKSVQNGTFWMQRCVEMQMNINALRNGGRA